MGSLTRSDAFNTALHATPPGGRAGITRPAVDGGALDAQGTAWVWLSRRDANRAMMQGTVDVRLDRDERRVFNVHENNQIPYDRAIRDSNLQPRFWSFRQVEGVLGYGEDDKIPLQSRMAVAGDVPAFGVGRVFALVDGDEEHVVVLADTGGAFEDNHHQLDWYTGSHASHEAFLEATATLPHHVQVFALVAPEDGPSK
jgi:membrane-bound lytic murein transglycosylase